MSKKRVKPTTSFSTKLIPNRKTSTVFDVAIEEEDSLSDTSSKSVSNGSNKDKTNSKATSDKPKLPFSGKAYLGNPEDNDKLDKTPTSVSDSQLSQLNFSEKVTKRGPTINKS